MKKGSCLCGKTKYQITGEIGDIVHCHCTTCRKAHGSAFSSVAVVHDADFQLESDLLNSFESSAGKFRYFCSGCGTQIYAKREGSAHIILRLGSMDDHPDAVEKSHIWVSQKASWYTLNQNLPEFSEFETDS